MRVLLTGAAGFIGYHLAERLIARGDDVFGYDNLDPYYDPALKQARLARLMERPAFRWKRGDVADGVALRAAADAARPDVIVHLAAQVGVRHAATNPRAYVDSNLVGFANVLELARELRPRHLVYASSSSVYGSVTRAPSDEHLAADHPRSLYAATKRANELLAHAYSHLHAIPTTGLRFFTVYGPWGRPDMAVFLFTEAILAGKPIRLFNGGAMRRDFTYVDDVVDALVRVADRAPAGEPAWSGERPDPATSSAPWRVYNVGNDSPVEVPRVVALLEAALGKKAVIVHEPADASEVLETCASQDDLARDHGFRPSTPIEEGLRRFVEWHRDWRAGRFDVRAAVRA